VVKYSKRQISVSRDELENRPNRKKSNTDVSSENEKRVRTR